MQLSGSASPRAAKGSALKHEDRAIEHLDEASPRAAKGSALKRGAVNRQELDWASPRAAKGSALKQGDLKGTHGRVSITPRRQRQRSETPA